MAIGNKQKLTGAQIVIEVLIEQGITDVFGYPGGQVLDIYDALYKSNSRLNHILTAHEQGAAHAADGYSRVTGKVGVVIATSGPGATNLVTGIATAMLDSVPMVAITGNVSTSLIGKDAFQEINITGITMPITKHNYFVTDISELADTIREAFLIAKSGRPGPVLIDIPKDIQTAEYAFQKKDKIHVLPQKSPDVALIEQAVKLIDSAKKPYIYIGGGAAACGLGNTVIALAQKTDAYIGSTFMGLSSIPSENERFLGMQGMHGRYASSVANKSADLVLGIGVRFSDRATGNFSEYSKDAKLIQLDTDISEINKNVTVDIGIVGDISVALNDILTKCAQKKHPKWHDEIAKAKCEEEKLYKHTSALPEKLTPVAIFNIINKYKSPDSPIVTDVGQHQMWTAQYMKFENPRTFASSGGLGTMGYGLGAAIGACIATNKRTLLMTGDGSFGMNLNELATAVSYNTPIVIVIFNNGALGMVRQWQTMFFEKHYSCTVLNRKTDFVKLADAFGAGAKKVTTVDEFENAFNEALNVCGPYVIDAVIDMDEFVLPMMPPGSTMDKIITEKENTK